MCAINRIEIEGKGEKRRETERELKEKIRTRKNRVIGNPTPWFAGSVRWYSLSQSGRCSWCGMVYNLYERTGKFGFLSG